MEMNQNKEVIDRIFPFQISNLTIFEEKQYLFSTVIHSTNRRTRFPKQWL